MSSATSQSAPSSELVITTFNVQNLFPATSDPDITKAGVITPESEARKRRKLALAVQQELELPAIIALQEIGDEIILSTLAAEINAAAGTRYAGAAPPTSDRRGIRLGFLWDERRVQLDNLEQLQGADVAAAFGPSSPNPGREPLIGIFTAGACRIVIVNNHFKSNFIPEANLHLAEQMLLANAAQRRAQAAVLQAFAAARLATDPQEWLLITGDFNDGSTAPDSPLGRLLRGEPQLIHLLFAAGIRDYTFMREGETQLLDHMLASPAMAAACTAVTVRHFNSHVHPALALDPTTPARSSDHDALEARFTLTG